MRKMMPKMMEMGAIQERIPRMMEIKKEKMSEADYSFQKFNKEQLPCFVKLIPIQK